MEAFELIGLTKNFGGQLAVDELSLVVPRGSFFGLLGPNVAGLCLGFGAIPLIPQGVVPAIFKLNGVDAKSWFLALYVAPGLQWLVIAGMAALGLGMYAYGGLTYWTASRLSPDPEAVQ